MDSLVKKWLNGGLVGCLSLIALSGCTYGSSSSQQPIAAIPVPAAPMPAQSADAPSTQEDPIMSKLQQMKVDDKIGQMIFAGIDGYTLDSHSVELLETYHVGGLILYKPNVESSDQLVKLVDSLKQANSVNKLPLWLGVDEEGGKVTRLPDEIVKMPSSKVVGMTGDPDFAYGVGNVLGKQLNAYGLNVDFAPVLDINSNPGNPVIGDRSFGSNASIVSKMGIEAMKGLQDQHILPVIKHFPGHGDTSVDSHLGLPIVLNDLARLHKLELIPFAEAIQQQADAIMVAHIMLPKVDGQYPASMSKKIMTDLLRKEIGFTGLIMTDDMTMGAISQNYELGEAAVQSVIAGSDVVMVGHDYEKAVTVIAALHKAVEENRISMEQIDHSVARIIKLKQKYQVQDSAASAPDVKKMNAEANQLLSTYLHK